MRVRKIVHASIQLSYRITFNNFAMDIPVVIIFLGLLIFIAYLFNALFEKTKVPNALLFLIIGIVLGPITGVVTQEHFGAIGPVFTNITLIILLFESGTNLKLNAFIKSIGSAFLLTLFNFIVSAVIATLVAWYFSKSLDLISASFFGIIVAGTSSAIVIPIIKQLKMNEKGATILILESALSDVLCLVLGLALLAAMKKGVFEITTILDTIWKSFLIAALIGLFAGIIWSVLLNIMRTIKNYTFSNLALAFIIAGATDYFGFNGGIAVLVFGITLGNAYLFSGKIFKEKFAPKELLEKEKNFFAEIVFIISTYFFVYVGVCIQFGNPVIYLLSFVIVMAIIIVRPVSVKLFVRSKMSFKDLSIMGIMSPKGLVPAILASIPLQLGIEGGEIIRDMSYSVVLLSIIICAVLVIILSKDPFMIGYLKKLLFGKSTDFTEND